MDVYADFCCCCCAIAKFRVLSGRRDRVGVVTFCDGDEGVVPVSSRSAGDASQCEEERIPLVRGFVDYKLW